MSSKVAELGALVIYLIANKLPFRAQACLQDYLITNKLPFIQIIYSMNNVQ